MDENELARTKLELLELIYAYAFSFDARQFEAWLDLWTDDARFKVYLPTRDVPLLECNSRTELEEEVVNLHRGLESPPGSSAFHLQSGTQFDHIDRDTAASRTMVHTFRQEIDDDGTGTLIQTDLLERASMTPLFGGIYYSRFRKANNDWKFSDRTFVASMKLPDFARPAWLA